MGLGRNLSKVASVRTCFTQLPAMLVDWCGVAQVTIDMLPDVALLEIFCFYLDNEDKDEGIYRKRVDVWLTLVHVCQKWRNTIFGSPCRLNLRLRCTESTPVRVNMDIWPLLPIVVDVCIGGFFDDLDELEWDTWDTDHIIAALEHNDRICAIEFFEFLSSQSGKVLPAMHQPFPALTRLDLDFVGETSV